MNDADKKETGQNRFSMSVVVGLSILSLLTFTNAVAAFRQAKMLDKHQRELDKMAQVDARLLDINSSLIISQQHNTILQKALMITMSDVWPGFQTNFMAALTNVVKGTK